LQHAEQMQRIEMIALRLENAVVKSFGLIQAPLPVKAERLAENLLRVH
jgi:hypothetical protein